MKNAALITLLLVVCVGFTAGQDTLLLFHPTSDNIAVIKNLADEKILDLECGRDPCPSSRPDAPQLCG